jgi:hypothetical protein
MIEPLGDDVRRELQRFGPQGAMSDVVAAWPAAVGPQIARNAWPARIARDGTVHVHTTDSVWAFELTHQAQAIAGRLGVAGLRFAAGPLPEPAEDPSATMTAAVPEPSPAERSQAAAIAGVVHDPDLRDRIARAVSLSLARARVGRRV